MRSRWGATDDRKAMQAVFSDGLASVSVFIEPATAGPVNEMAQSVGPVSAYVRGVANARITVVGEVPLATVKALANSVEYRAPH
jgi:sigma-E factor negative regulatory protein RseB